MRMILAAALIALPGLALAAGGGDSTPPKPTETTKNCWGKRVWDAGLQKCVKPAQSSLNSDELMQAARELAHAERFEDAQAVLAAMPNQDDDLVMTYWGFTHRKLGNLDAAAMFYSAALEQNPNNLLARSYMAQGFVGQGDLDAAKAQLAEIVTRGGGYSWAATSLRQAIYLGETFNY